MLPSGARRRPAPREFLSRRAQRPLTSCAFLLVAFSLIYICCVLVSFFRGHGNYPQPPDPPNLELRRAGQGRTADPDGNDVVANQEAPQDPPPQPTLLERLKAPLQQSPPRDPQRIQPDRNRAHDLEYEICPSSAYAVPNYGPLLLMQRSESTACAVYLYAAPFARTTPLLPALPALSDSPPPPPQAWQPRTPQTPLDTSFQDSSTDNPTAANSSTSPVKVRPDPSLIHQFRDPVLSPGELGVKTPKLTPERSTPKAMQQAALQRPDVGSDSTDGDTLQETDAATQDTQDEDSEQDPPVDTQDADDDSTKPPADDQLQEDATTSVESQQRRRRLQEATPQISTESMPTRIPTNSTAQARSKQTSLVLSASDEATGVLAAAIMLAATEMQSTSADLASFPTLHTPPATASLPEDIGRWSHVQLDKVFSLSLSVRETTAHISSGPRFVLHEYLGLVTPHHHNSVSMQAMKLQAAWRSGNTTALAYPHALALLNHPSRAAVARAFASAASCLLQRLGGPAAASPAAHVSAAEAADAVVSWPQYLSYEAAESMPTGREASTPGALMRGLFVAHANGSVILDFYDPRAPLDSEEVQDSVPDMYRIELRTGDLALLPPWVLTSFLAVPPFEQNNDAAPTSMYQYVQHASSRARHLGFHSSVNTEDFPQPLHSTHAAILHLTLPGDPSLSAGSILPMHMGPLKAPTLSQMHAKSRKLFNLYEEQGDKGYEEAEDTGDVDEERSPPDEPGGNNADAIGWADQERRFEQPVLNDPGVPLVRPSKPQNASLHVPGDEEQQDQQPTVPGLVTPDSVHAPGETVTSTDTVVEVGQRQSGLESTQQQTSGENVAIGAPGEEPRDSHDQEDTCVDVDRIWFAFGSPMTVYSLPEVDPQLDLHALRSLALTAFEAFKNCLPDRGEQFDRASPGSLGDELFAWQSSWPDAGTTPCDGGQPGSIGQQVEREWRAAYTAYLESDEHSHMLRAVATTVVSMLKRMGKDDLADDQDPGIFSWLTVHDESMSYHGRHYHRNQALTAVLYLEVPHESAPLEFSNPIEGPDSQPNGRTVFVPNIGDFVLFPSYLGHTVPMRLLRDKLQPRISIAFNIWLAGPGLDRFSEDQSEEQRDDVGKHQYFAVSDVTMDRYFMPREGLDQEIERDDYIL